MCPKSPKVSQPSPFPYAGLRRRTCFAILLATATAFWLGFETAKKRDASGRVDRRQLESNWGLLHQEPRLAHRAAPTACRNSAERSSALRRNERHRESLLMIIRPEVDIGRIDPPARVRIAVPEDGRSLLGTAKQDRESGLSRYWGSFSGLLLRLPGRLELSKRRC
jgi:hypothetical protein